MTRRSKFQLRLPSRTLVLGERTLIMGVLNITPDSFSDARQFLNPRDAVVHALEIERAGADILDVGGESTRPGSKPLDASKELERVLPVLKPLRDALKIPISIDTRKAVVAREAICAGVEIVNDISALRFDAELARIVARAKVGIILMHMRGEPQAMQKGPFARDVIPDVKKGLREALRRAVQAGIERTRILLDPGIGFGKNYLQNFEILARLPELAEFKRPIVTGTSRKAFIGASLGNAPANERSWGTAATVVASILGGAHVVRVHDVKEMAQVARIADRIAAAQA